MTTTDAGTPTEDPRRHPTHRPRSCSRPWCRLVVAAARQRQGRRRPPRPPATGAAATTAPARRLRHHRRDRRRRRPPRRRAGAPPTAATTARRRGGGKIIVGSADFPESQLLAQIYGQALAAAGFDVDYQLAIGSREVYYKAIENGEIDLVPEYTQLLLSFLTGPERRRRRQRRGAGRRAGRALPDALEVLTPSTAEDKDVIVCTEDAADKYNLTDRRACSPSSTDHHRRAARVRDPLAVRPRRLQGDLRRRVQVVRAARRPPSPTPVGRPDRLRQPVLDDVGDHDRRLRGARGRQEHGANEAVLPLCGPRS